MTPPIIPPNPDGAPVPGADPSTNPDLALPPQPDVLVAPGLADRDDMMYEGIGAITMATDNPPGRDGDRFDGISSRLRALKEAHNTHRQAQQAHDKEFRTYVGQTIHSGVVGGESPNRVVPRNSRERRAETHTINKLHELEAAGVKAQAEAVMYGEHGKIHKLATHAARLRHLRETNQAYRAGTIDAEERRTELQRVLRPDAEMLVISPAKRVVRARSAHDNLQDTLLDHAIYPAPPVIQRPASPGIAQTPEATSTPGQWDALRDPDALRKIKQKIDHNTDTLLEERHVLSFLPPEKTPRVNKDGKLERDRAPVPVIDKVMEHPKIRYEVAGEAVKSQFGMNLQELATGGAPQEVVDKLIEAGIITKSDVKTAIREREKALQAERDAELASYVDPERIAQLREKRDEIVDKQLAAARLKAEEQGDDFDETVALADIKRTVTAIALQVHFDKTQEELDAEDIPRDIQDAVAGMLDAEPKSSAADDSEEDDPAPNVPRPARTSKEVGVRSTDPWHVALEYTAQLQQKYGNISMSPESIANRLGRLGLTPDQAAQVYRQMQREGIVSTVYTPEKGFLVLKNPEDIRALIDS